MNYVQDNMFLGQLPKRLVIGCVDSDTLNGTITKIPFDFKHYHASFPYWHRVPYNCEYNLRFDLVVFKIERDFRNSPI
jgi:hypothetical protein